MKKIVSISIMAVTFLIMSVSCNRAGVPAATLLPAKQDNWQHYNFDKKATVDKYGADKAQFATESELYIYRTRDTSFLNTRGDIVDSTIKETRTIDAYRTCLVVDVKEVDGWTVYKMEFKLKKTNKFIYVYYSGKADENGGEFTVKEVPESPGQIMVAFSKTSKPELWSIATTGQVLLYSGKAGERSEDLDATENLLRGRKTK